MRINMLFIYVMDEKSKKYLIKRGFKLIKEDEANSIWVFENKETVCFENGEDVLAVPHVLSNVLTF